MRFPDLDKTHFKQYWFLLGILVLAFYVFSSAISNSLFVDDYVNLTYLTEVKAQGYAYYIFNGVASELGRPISLLTFALQHDDWPHNLENFKLVNILIHLLNGFLIYCISRILFCQLNFTSKEVFISSFLVTGLWIFHPIHLTTIFYIVQRMTLLSTFFMLVGLLGYLYFRVICVSANTRKQFIGMSLSLCIGILAGVLAKENAIILPLYILSIEFTLLSKKSRPKNWRIWALVFLVVPLVMLLVYLTIRFDDTLSGYIIRPFSMGERLLTQQVVLVSYLKGILFPQLGYYSVFHDDFVISHSLFSPINTLFSSLLLLMMASIAVLYRKKYSSLSFAILWFLSGHSLEASFVNLELYFEHRNYLPSFGLIFLYGSLIIFVLRFLKNKLVATLMCFMLYFASFAVTMMELSVWKNPVLQAHEWVRNHPKSKRAIDHLGVQYIRAGNVDKAIKHYLQIQEEDLFSYDLYPHLKVIKLKACVKHEKPADLEWKELNEKAQTFRWSGHAVVAELDDLVSQIHKDECGEIDVYKLAELILTLAGNPEFSSSVVLFHELVASLSIKVGDLNTALLNIKEAIKVNNKPDLQIMKIKLELAMRRIDEAEESMVSLEEYLVKKPMRAIAFKKRLNTFRAQLKVLKATEYGL